MNYANADDVAELRANAQFIRITLAGMRESKPGETET